MVIKKVHNVIVAQDQSATFPLGEHGQLCNEYRTVTNQHDAKVSSSTAVQPSPKISRVAARMKWFQSIVYECNLNLKVLSL